jgi:hypothetical protein
MQRRGKEAAARLERSMALAPASSLPYEALGLNALLDDDYGRATAMFAEALKRDARSYRSHFYFAHAAMQLDEEAADASIRAALARAAELNPAFPDPYPLLSRLARREGNYDVAVSWAERGLALSPNDGAVRLALAHAQVAKRRFSEGEVNLRHVAATEENFALRSAARVALRSLESYLTAVKSSAGHARGADPAARLDVPLGVLEEIPEWLHLAPAGVRGRLERLDCAGTSMIARVRVAGRRFTYSTNDAPKVTILTLKHPGVELIDCDKPIDRDAIVEFEPDPIDPTVGRLKAIVFLTPKPYTIVMTPERSK